MPLVSSALSFLGQKEEELHKIRYFSKRWIEVMRFFDLSPHSLLHFFIADSHLPQLGVRQNAMPTDFGDLPYELVAQIVALSVEDTAYSLAFTSTLDARYKYLSQLATLSRQFRYPAQAVLWSAIRIDSQAMAHKWLASPVTAEERHPVHDLEMRGVHLRKDGVTATAANRVVFRCRGVKRLELHDFGRLSVKILGMDALYGLQHLVLLTSFPDKPHVIEALTLPFHIRTLNLYNRHNLPHLLDKILATSAHSLQNLELSLNDHDSSYAGLVRSFHHVAPTITRLALNHKPTPELIVQFKTCYALKSLDCHTAVDVEAVLDCLPCSLESLSIQVDYNLQEIVEYLDRRMESPALKELKVLSMSETTLTAFHLNPSAERFREYWGKRGLEIKGKSWD